MSWLFKASPSPEPAVGVKEDLSAIGDTIGRQLRGVANFLAPPPPPSSSSAAEVEEPSPATSSSRALEGIKSDLAEIGGSLKSGLSKFTSGFLPFKKNPNEDDKDEYVGGITEAVVEFVEEISSRPECWTDFPLPLQDDFRMSDAQRDHASAIEDVVPSLAALRANLHDHIGDKRFWMVYFVLLLPRLSEEDFEILSTTQIVEMRAFLLQKIQSKRNAKAKKLENSSTILSSEDELGEGTILSGEQEVTQIVKATGKLEIGDKEITEHWLEETDVDAGTSTENRRRLESEEDVSFSDLEDDDNDLSGRVSVSRQALSHRGLSPSGSSDWIQLHESSTQVGTLKARQSFSRDKDSDIESTDWLKVDEFD